MLVSVSYSQTSENSKVTDRAELVTRCEQAKDEIIAGRALISQLTESLEKYEDALGKAEEVENLSEQEIGFLKAERDAVRKALDLERGALAKKELEVIEYQKALAKMTKKKNFFKNLTKVLTVSTGTLAAIAATVILKE
jgi:hypothetical protein